MTNNLSSTPLRLNQLKTISKTLKSEFFGIDDVIDKIINYFSAWYCLPHTESRPMVINLWGLTGVGKTSLINRLIELLHLQKDYSSFDFSNTKLLRDFPDYVANLNQAEAGKGRIFLFDEFQHVSKQNNSSNYPGFTLGSFFDWVYTGKLNYHFPNHYYTNMANSLKRLRRALDLGCKIVNGEITEGAEAYTFGGTEFVFGKRRQGDNTIPAIDFVDIVEEAPNSKYKSNHEFIDESKNYSGEDFYRFIERELNQVLRPIEVTIPNALIFIAGNLDEAFGPIVQSFDMETDADLLHELVKKMSISDVKSGLAERLRPEWLARLGNNHVLYPSLSEKAFRVYIDERIKYYMTSISGQLGVPVHCTGGVSKIIYKEGVQPAQGIRPLDSTIHSFFMNNFITLIPGLAHQIDDNCSVVLNIQDDGYFEVQVQCKKDILVKVGNHFPLEHVKLLNEKNEDQTACVAVHEAGHALTQVVLLQTLPKKISCKTTSARIQGYVANGISSEFVKTKSYYLNRIAVLFAGIEAERLVFGEDLLTAGSVNDISVATRLASMIVRESGLTGFNAQIEPINSQDPNTVKDKENETDIFISNLLEGERKRARNILEAHREILAELSSTIYEHEILLEDQIEQFFTRVELIPKSRSNSHLEMFKTFTKSYQSVEENLQLSA